VARKGNNMCKFKSAIYHQNLGLLHDDYTDSHEDLVNFYNLDDKTNLHKFVRLEYSPDLNKDYCNINKYTLKVDEGFIPIWFTDDLRMECEHQLKFLVEKCILKDKKIECLLSGVYILCGETFVNYTRHCRIFQMQGTSTIGAMQGSSIVDMMQDSSKVTEMCGSSKIIEMRNNSIVSMIQDSSTIVTMRESATVGKMWDSSRIGVMLGGSTVGEMRGSSKVSVMQDDSKISEMWENSTVSAMWDRSKIDTMQDSSRVIEYLGNRHLKRQEGFSHAIRSFLKK
jgi:hypothetical protein